MTLGYAFAIAASLAATGAPCLGQQAPDSSFAGKYEFSFVPSNGEPITGQLMITRKGDKYYGVITSPKLSEPLDADSVRVVGSHLFTSSFGGAYTFAFDMHGTSITGATFTKSMRGVTEEGSLSIKKVRP